MKDMIIEHVEHTIQSGGGERSGVIIHFKSEKVLKSLYVCMFKKGVEKYFQVLSVKSDNTSDLLTYKAIDCGYGIDRVSKDMDLDIREITGSVVIEVLDKDEILDIRKRNSYT